VSDAPDPASIPIAYAQGPAEVRRAVPRPTWLVLPNVLAMSFLFQHYVDDTIMQSLLGFARNLFPSTRGHELWDAMLCAPFLLSIPLALWTIRLAIWPTPRKLERSIAWAISCASVGVTLIMIAYAGFVKMFQPAAVAVVVFIIVSVWVIWTTRHWMTSYLPALLAMTAAHVANTLLTMLVVLSHSERNLSVEFTLLVVAAQITASAILIICFAVPNAPQAE
jgi:hypothetical protein